MKALVLVLILIAFLQSTLVPLNLCLIIIILRAYIKPESSNFYLAFAIGLVVSFLDHQTLGVNSLIYLVAVALTHSLSKTPLSKNILGVLPLIFIELGLIYLLNAYLLQQTPSIFPRLIIETVISLPIYIALRFWEERFVVRQDVRLKI